MNIEEEDFTTMRLNHNRLIERRYMHHHHHHIPSNDHAVIFPSPSSISIRRSTTTPTETTSTTVSPSKSNPKFLAFFIQAVVMAIVILLFFLFVGIAAIVLIHIAIIGRAIHRRRYRRSLSTATRSDDLMEDDLDFGGVGFGLSHRDLNKLQAFYYGSGGEKSDSSSSSSEDCAVCLEALKQGERSRILPQCKHVFHANCIDSWLIRVPACPVCRGTVDPNSDTDGFEDSNNEFM
ncbi:hypothetical protein MKW98_014007 [Papaver atlanticum]|uniref:RING-type domain-containing protein n=1 Tax=Papaver atlanticum TaxID=357466 RepID=A0AAD4SLG2_9MAGN|nr:hypothetical protein MKX03_007761 [Papaver bracteatum]KAI3909590.1 hypothetical protein MKW98_014007 [Papaver atlanticum]